MTPSQIEDWKLYLNWFQQDNIWACYLDCKQIIVKTFGSLEIGFCNMFLCNLWWCQQLNIQVCPLIFHCLAKTAFIASFVVAMCALSLISASFLRCSIFNSIEDFNHGSWFNHGSQWAQALDIIWGCNNSQSISPVCEGVVRVFQCLYKSENAVFEGG